MAVMDHLWGAKAASVKHTHRVLGKARGITLNTVQSAMDRLFRKGLLSRDKVSHAFVYRPAMSREELSTQVLSDVLDTLAGGETGVMLSAFVSLAEREGEDALAQLEALIAAKRRGTEA